MPFEGSPRLARILALHGEALAAVAIAREGSNADSVDPAGLLLTLAEADPSRNKSATQWLVLTYIAGGFLLEDLDKARDTLLIFSRHRRRLREDARDLGRYRTLADVWKAVKPFEETETPATTSGRQTRFLDRERARAESEIIFEGEDGFTVAVPMTEFAAKWWGRGTRWCTAASKNNAFAKYHAVAPLVVIILPGEGKFQLFAASPGFSCYFMDSDDKEADPETVRRWWSRLRPVFEWAIIQNGFALTLIPETLRDYGLCMKAVLNPGTRTTLAYVPEELRTPEICMEAVRRNGVELSQVPDALLNLEITLEGVRQHKEAVAFVHAKLERRNVYMEAVLHDGEALEFIPARSRTRRLCLAAVRQNGEALAYVPEKHLDYAMCLEAVSRTGSALSHVPETFRDLEMCKVALAVAASGDGVLCWVPEDLMDYGMCLDAIRDKGESLLFVPYQFRDYSLCLEAVQRIGGALNFVPEELRNESLCLEAVRNDGSALAYVPVGLRTYELCREAVRCKPGDTPLRPEVVKNVKYVLRLVPEELRTMEICLAAVRQDPLALEFVPDELREDVKAQADPLVKDQRWSDSVFDGLSEGLAAYTAGNGKAASL